MHDNACRLGFSLLWEASTWGGCLVGDNLVVVETKQQSLVM